MSCKAPIAELELTSYWANDLPADEVERIDLHLLGCAACTAQAERIHAVVEAVRTLVPPVVTRDQIAALRALGMRIDERSYSPDRTQTAVFGPHTDVMIHRLAHFDLTDAERVSVSVRIADREGTVVEYANAPFDRDDGVLIACQRHYERFGSDVYVDVTALGRSGGQRKATYHIPHVFPKGREADSRHEP
jgi:hypothetical protein